jgi:predicted transcriptional regulator
MFSEENPLRVRRRPMENKRESAHDIAEEGLDKLVEGDTEAGEKLIDKAKKIDPKAVEELAEEVERDKENAERFVNRKPA